MGVVRPLCCFLLFAGLASAQTAVFPLRDIRPGMKGIGKTVFEGSRVDEFQVEVLGVLENSGPKQSLILARLSGGPLERTGVMQGMSGSPVYIDGKLAGAVAMSFALSKEPIAAIRPIEDMLSIADQPQPQQRRARLWDGELAKSLPPPSEVATGGGRLVEIATPVSFAGFSPGVVAHFAPQLRALGLEPTQGIAGGSSPAGAAPPGSIEPGSMITVQLMTGDLSIGADGTVTHVDGNRIYAFGHRFLSVGATELPFARSEVLALLPNLSTSYKISAAREWAGTITQDRTVAVAGELGRKAAMMPVSISVVRHGENGPERQSSYNLEVVRDPILSPFLLQMAVLSTIEATEHMIGASTFAISGQIDFEGSAVPMKLNNAFTGDANVPAQAALGAATSVSYVMQSGFDALRPRRVALTIDAYPSRRTLNIEQLWTSRRVVKPGEPFDIIVLLSGDNGLEITRKVTYSVPVGARPGLLHVTAAEAGLMNLVDFRQMLTQSPRSAGQLVSMMNAMRSSTSAWVRVWRAEPSFDVQGSTLPDPPPSAALVLARSNSSLNPAQVVPNSKVAEFEVPAGMVVTGSKTIQVEVKE
jgi:hypothetical protein